MAKKKAKPSAPDDNYVDPGVTHLEKGLKALHGGKLPTARTAFEKAIEESAQVQIAASARSYLRVVAAREKPVKDTADPYLLAVMAKNDGDLETAADLCTRGGRRSKDERFAYLAASVQALAGNHEEAVAQLKVAIELNPAHRVHAFHDGDFEDLLENEGFVSLYEGILPSPADAAEEADAGEEAETEAEDESESPEAEAEAT